MSGPTSKTDSPRAQSASQNSTGQKQNFDIYDYIFRLEEDVKALNTERNMVTAKATALEVELERMKKELREMRATPLIVGTITELLENGTKAIIKNSNGMEFYISIPNSLTNTLKPSSRVALSQRSLAVVHVLPECKDTRVSAMEIINKPSVSMDAVGGLHPVIQELEETVALPLTSPEKFEKLGIDSPNGVLLFGEPGTGKTLLAKAIANKTNSTFVSLAGSELVRKFIGEGSEIVRDVFKLAAEKESTIIFIDELDAIAAERVPTASGDREVQRTLMQLLAEMDGFKARKNVKLIAATNRLDIIDPAILRPGRFDRIIEVPVPDKASREEIFKVHTGKMSLAKDISLESLASCTEGATGAEIKAICTEAGMFALRGERSEVSNSDFKSAFVKVLGEQDSEFRAAEKMYA